MIFWDTELRASVQHSSGQNIIGLGGWSRVLMPVSINLVKTVLSWRVCMYVCVWGGLELSYLWEERRESEDLRGPGKGLLVYLCTSVARTEEGVIW